MTKNNALACGYVTEKALQEVENLDDRTLKLIAAMALTYRRSPWSDRSRDLLRGIEALLGE